MAHAVQHWHDRRPRPNGGAEIIDCRGERIGFNRQQYGIVTPIEVIRRDELRRHCDVAVRADDL
jgi:hypothetical protein